MERHSQVKCPVLVTLYIQGCQHGGQAFVHDDDVCVYVCACTREGEGRGKRERGREEKERGGDF